MAVSLTISKTLGGSASTDLLSAGGAGVDFGNVVNSEYCPIDSKTANTGWQSLYIRHNGTEEIVDVATFIAEYSQTYGGSAINAAADYATLKAKGNASGNSANNGDGLSAGLRVEQDADIAGGLGLSAFDGSRTQVKMYGKSSLGIDITTAFLVHQDAMLRNNSGTPVDASSPVAGKIGAAGNAVLGDTAFLKLRFYLESAAPEGGIMQWDWVVRYSFTD
jgi:hypothetical protein